MFFTKITKTEVDPVTGKEEEKSFPLLKTYMVFNVDQVEGPFDHLRVKEESLNINPAFVDYDPAEETIKGTGADIRFGGDHALYNRQDDFILCPPKHRFKEEKDYYSTIFHELAHWTGHESRLNRGTAGSLWRPGLCGRGTGCRNGIVLYARRPWCAPILDLTNRRATSPTGSKP